MSTNERRIREKKHRREQILNAAEQIVFDRGIETFRMEEVAEAAEVSKGTLYLYFKSKTELVLGVHHRGMKIIVSDMARELSKPGKGISLIQSMASVFFRFADEHPHYYALFLYFESLGIDTLRELMETETMKESNKLGDELFHYIVRAVQVGIQDGTVESSFNPHEIALQIMAATRGLVQLAHFYDQKVFLTEEMRKEDYNIKSMIDGYMNMLIRALKPQ